jgi:hypothetical protein
MLHRLIGFLLLLCLAAPCTLTIVGLQHQKHLVKKAVKAQMIAGLEDSQLVTLAFLTSEVPSVIEWEHAAEFEYHGQMYDVVASEEKGDSTYYRCWPDYEESALNQQLARTVSGIWEKNPLKKQNEQRLFDFFKLLYCAESAAQPPVFAEVSGTTLPHLPYRFHLPTGVFSPNAPPPELFVRNDSSMY